MSVLQRKELEASPLADLHAIASELGVEGFRGMRKRDLIAAILSEQDDGDGAPPDETPVEVEVDEPAAQPEELEPEPADAEETEPEPDEPDPVEEEPEEDEPPSDDEIATGILDILPNGSGFLRVGVAGQSAGDVYISPAQIRRCELRAGDDVSGPVRPPRRNERHPSLVRVETVNGGDAEPPEERPLFSDLTAVYPSQKLEAPKELKDAPFGRGSRVAIAGSPGSGASALLREVVATLAKEHSDLEVQVVLCGARPEEPAEWLADGHAPVTGGSFDSSPEAQTQAAELAIERAKRAAERGGHAAVVVDSLELLPAGAQRRVFGAGRATEEAGSVTVIAAVGLAVEPLRWATTRVVLEPQSPTGTLRADLLG